MSGFRARSRILFALALFTLTLSAMWIQCEGHVYDSAPPARTLLIDTASFTIATSPATASPGEEVTVFVNATSTIPDATVTVSIFYDAYDTPFVNNTESPRTLNATGNPAHIVQKFTYSQPGNFTNVYGRHFYWIKAYVQDNASGTITTRIQYFVNNNSAPTWIATVYDPLRTEPGKTENLSIMMQDMDNDTLTVDWEFGDGTTAQDVVSSTLVYAFVNRSHSWNPIVPPSGEDRFVNYTMNLTVNDAHGNYLNYSSTVVVFIERNWSPLPRLEASKQSFDPSEAVIFNASVRDREGDPIWWYFDFGDGTGVTDYTERANPNSTIWNNQTHRFPDTENATSYNITVYVTDGVADHNTSMSVEVFVVPNNPPAATINISHQPDYLLIDPATGYLNVTFWIMVVDPEGDVVTATWDLDDGTGPRVNTSEPVPSWHVFTFRQWRNFTSPTQFNISVVVTDGFQGHAITRWLNSTVVSDNYPPILTMAPTWFYHHGSEARPDETLFIELMATDAEFDPLGITWDFGDGTPILSLNYSLSDYQGGNVTFNASHAYAEVGDYTIRIRITDNQLGWGDHVLLIIAEVVVRLPYPQADSGGNVNAWVGDEVQFDGTTNEWPQYYNYTWTFTYDGNTVTLYGMSPIFTFLIPGTYVVTLRVWDGLVEWRNYSTDTTTVTVLATPVPELSNSAVMLIVMASVGILMIAWTRRRIPS